MLVRMSTQAEGRVGFDIYPASPSGWSNILILRCYFSALMVYFRCFVVVSSLLCLCVHVFDIPRCSCPFFCIEKRRRSMSGVFNSPHGQKGGEKKRRGKEKRKKGRRKLKIAETDSKARKQKQDGMGKKRLQDIILPSLSLSFSCCFPVTGTIFVILPRGIEME